MPMVLSLYRLSSLNKTRRWAARREKAMLDGTTPTLQSTIGTNYYGNVWLALASIAYADEKSASGAPAAIKAVFAGWNEKGKNYFPAPTLSAQPIPGTWVVD